MPEAFASAVVPAPADATWTVVRDFDGLPTWHPAIATSELEAGGASDRVGSVRNLTLADGARVSEALVTLDDHERRYTYTILTSPFPVRGYRSTVHVLPLTETEESFVAWSVVFDCDETDSERLIRLFSEDVFGTGLRGLAAFLGSSRT